MALNFTPPPYQARPDYERQAFYGMSKNIGDIGDVVLQLAEMKRLREQQALENAQKQRVYDETHGVQTYPGLGSLIDTGLPGSRPTPYQVPQSPQSAPGTVNPFVPGYQPQTEAQAQQYAQGNAPKVGLDTNLSPLVSRFMTMKGNTPIDKAQSYRNMTNMQAPFDYSQYGLSPEVGRQNLGFKRGFIPGTETFTKIESVKNLTSVDKMKELERRKIESEISKNEAETFAKRNAEPKPTVAESAIDKNFAKDYEQYVLGGGYADVLNQISSLEGVLGELENKDRTYNISGPGIGSLPDFVRERIYPDSYQAQQTVEQSVQRTLRQTLGPQFTAVEGMQFMKRGYNPAFDEKKNAEKLRMALSQLRTMANAKQRAVEYYEKNGTLKGFKGNLYLLQNGIPVLASPSESESIVTGIPVNNKRVTVTNFTVTPQ
jgi:hypothetical protein